MIGKGYVVEDDLMGIARRIRAIDPSYFVFYSYEKRRYEVYCSDDLAVAAVVLPFDRLDERSVRKVLETRRENRKKLLESIERENRLMQKRNVRAAVKDIERKAERVFGGKYE